jgi:hypothetical protein
MEIVFVLAGLLGLVLLIVPRLRRSRRRVLRSARGQWKGPAASTRRRRAVRPPRATPSRPGG